MKTALFVSASFLTAWCLGWAVESHHASLSAQRLSRILEPSIRAGDEMSVIDLVDSLRDSPDLLALRVSSAGRTWASFGSAPEPGSDRGPDFRLPSTWITDRTWAGSGTMACITSVESRAPGPWGWGFLAALAAGAGSRVFRVRSKPAPPPTLVSSSPDPEPDASVLDAALLGLLERQAGHAFLLLDSGFRVLAVTPTVSRILGREEPVLPFSHLLDLDPGPALVTALEKGSVVEVAQPFRSGAVRAAAIDKTTFGYLLELRP